jgi:hypothetical protein
MTRVRFQHSSLAILLVAGAVCAQEKPLRFTGEAKAGEDFRKPIGHGLAFRLDQDQDGWTIEVGPEGRSSCEDFVSVIATPLRGPQINKINTDYGVSAADAVQRTRQFPFVLNEKDCALESARREIILWPYSYPKEEANQALAHFGTSPTGTAVVRFLDSRISPSGRLVQGKDLGKIDWIKFEVTITFPAKR